MKLLHMSLSVAISFTAVPRCGSRFRVLHRPIGRPLGLLNIRLRGMLKLCHEMRQLVVDIVPPFSVTVASVHLKHDFSAAAVITNPDEGAINRCINVGPVIFQDIERRVLSDFGRRAVKNSLRGRSRSASSFFACPAARVSSLGPTIRVNSGAARDLSTRTPSTFTR